MGKNIKVKRNLRNSVAFKEWWKARQGLEPVPKDPYRAFMIDRSLNASQPGKDKWERRTNRADVVPIDTPPRSRPRPSKITRSTPKKKRRKPTSKEDKRAKELRTRLDKIAVEMSGKYGVGIPALKIKRGGMLDAPTVLHSRVWGRAYGGIVRLPLGQQKSTIDIGFPLGGSFTDAEDKYRHEMGHHIDDELLWQKHGDPYARYVEKIQFGGRETPFMRQEKYKGERRAWNIAREFKKNETPRSAWDRRFALQTYRRDVKVDIGEGKKGKRRMVFKFGDLRPGIIIGDMGNLPAIDFTPKKKVSMTSKDGSYRWGIKPRKPIRII